MSRNNLISIPSLGKYRLGSVMVLSLMLLLLVGCSKGNGAKECSIDGYDWVMTSVQNESGQIIACGGGNDETEGIPIMRLTCKAENGNIILDLEEKGEKHEGTYELREKEIKSGIYNIRFGGGEGIAVVSQTAYQDGKDKPTLVMNIDGYGINFFAR